MATQPRILSFDVGLRNLAFCYLQTNPEVKILLWELCDIVGPGRNAKQMPIRRATELLLQFLNKRFTGLQPCIIAIEQQPGAGRCRNLKMKIMSHVLHSFFYLRGHKVHFISPRQKLGGVAHCKRNYEQNKAFCVGKCRAELSRFDPKWSKYFEGLAKKDDAADALLQGLVLVEKVRPASNVGDKA